MQHRHLVHSDFSLPAVDDIISRGGRDDWAALATAIKGDAGLRERVLRICAAHVADPTSQRYHFWKYYAERTAHR